MNDLRRPVSVLVLFSVFAVATALVAAQATRPGQPTPRDRPAQQASDAGVPKGRIAGLVVASDTGRPVARARVFLSGAGLQGGRGALTDTDGRYELSELPEGRFTLTAGKTGFITVAYGQRRPLQAGIPIQLGADQQLTGVDFRLPRGSVIAGHIYDEVGDPLPGANVRVLRYEYAQGNRQLVPAGNAQTDDLGAYRVWGLNPGEYYVSAVTPPFGPGGRGFGFGGPFGGRGGRGGQPAGGGGRVDQSQDEEQTGYAPTFYPGVPSMSEARPVSVALSTEVPSVDFSILLVRTARVSGRVSTANGTAATAGNVVLMPENAGRAGRGGAGGTFASRIDWDGSFGMTGVAPGRYLLRARSDDTEEPQFALQPVTVGDSDLTNLAVILSASAAVTGTVSFQTSQGNAPPDPGQIRVAAPSVDGIVIGPNPTTRVDRNGSFTLDGIQAGTHILRTQSAPRGWMLKSVTMNGRDTIDTPFELRSGQTLSGVTLVFTDRLTEVNGTVADANGAPVTDYTLLAFPEDEQLWRPQSRQIATTRADQNGKYQLRGLPAGAYYLVAVDPAEQGEWFEPAYLSAHRAGATRFTLSEGDTITRDFSVGNR